MEQQITLEKRPWNEHAIAAYNAMLEYGKGDIDGLCSDFYKAFNPSERQPIVAFASHQDAKVLQYAINTSTFSALPPSYQAEQARGVRADASIHPKDHMIDIFIGSFDRMHALYTTYRSGQEPITDVNAVAEFVNGFNQIATAPVVNWKSVATFLSQENIQPSHLWGAYAATMLKKSPLEAIEIIDRLDTVYKQRRSNQSGVESYHLLHDLLHEFTIIRELFRNESQGTMFGWLETKLHSRGIWYNVNKGRYWVADGWEKSRK